MRKYIILLLLFAVFVACGEDELNLHLIEKSNVQSVSLPITDEVRQLIFPDPETLDRQSWIEMRQLQETFYTRYVESDGLYVIGSDNVTEDEFRIGIGILLTMTSKRPELRELISIPGSKVFKEYPLQQRWYFVIIGKGESYNSIPETHGLKPRRAAGGCSNSWCAISSNWNWGGFVHEFGHAMNFAMREIDPFFDSKHVLPLYNQAMSEGKYEGMYAAVNSNEYFAEAIKWWFLGHDGFETRQEILEYDPGLYELLAEWLPETNLVLE